MINLPGHLSPKPFTAHITARYRCPLLTVAFAVLQVYRVIDFARSGGSGSAVVQRLEYDPNRSARIALVKHKGVADDAPLRSQYSYILAPQVRALMHPLVLSFF